MSNVRTLNSGDHTSFTTRPVGQSTRLFIKSKIDDGGKTFAAKAMYKVLLIGHHDQTVDLNPGEQKDFDISVAGGLVEVRNEGNWSVETWTDY